MLRIVSLFVFLVASEAVAIPALRSSLRSYALGRGLALRATPACELDWELFGGMCYKQFGSGPDNLYFWDAHNECENFNGDLASVHDVSTNDFLMGIVNANGGHGHFLGMHVTVEEELSWTDGSSVDFELWKQGEPNLPRAVGIESCVHMNKNGEWADQRCDQKSRYICQHPRNDVNPVVPQCEAVMTRIAFSNAEGAVPVYSLGVHQGEECLATCKENPDCLAVDLNLGLAAQAGGPWQGVYCWHHMEEYEEILDNPFVDHYKKEIVCS